MKWDNPSADQFYLMQVTMEIRKILYALQQNKTPLELKEFQIPFSRGGDESKEEASPLTMEQATAISMRKWFAITGYKGT